MMKLRKNNRGFSLVELIVATAILAIVALGAGAFMVAGTRTYSSLNYTVRLQYEAQLAMAQLQELTVDCAKGIAWAPVYNADSTLNKGTLYIANENEVHVFDYDGSGKTISYSYQSGPPAETLDFTQSDCVADALLAEHVESMNVTIVPIPIEGKEDQTSQVEITLGMARGGKSYAAKQVIALRNQPVHASSWSALWSNM